MFVFMGFSRKIVLYEVCVSICFSVIDEEVFWYLICCVGSWICWCIRKFNIFCLYFRFRYVGFCIYIGKKFKLGMLNFSLFVLFVILLIVVYEFGDEIMGILVFYLKLWGFFRLIFLNNLFVCVFVYKSCWIYFFWFCDFRVLGNL